MAINWVEIGLIVALNGAILAGIGLYARYKAFPKLKAAAGEWAGAAIGRFWQTLAEQAAEEEGSGTTSTASGSLKLGGFQIDVGTIKELMKIAPQLIQLAQTFGLVKGGSGGGENPFL